MSKPKLDDPEQSQRFVAMARELGADSTASAFKRKIRAIAGAAKTKREPLQPRKRSAKRRTP